MATRTRKKWNGNSAIARFTVPIDSLAPHPDNPRGHDLEAIASSLEAFGQQRPILVVPAGRVDPDRATIIAGHGTTASAQEHLGWTHIAALESDLTDEEIERYVLADNRTSDLGTYDDELLAKLLERAAESRAGLQGTGYVRQDLQTLLAEIAHRAKRKSARDPDDAPEPPAKPKSKLGEVYELGPHLLMCGDATDEEHVRELFSPPRHHGLDQVDAIWTDPPYGVNYVGKTKDALTIANDEAGGVRELLGDALRTVRPALAAHARFYITGPAGPRALDFHLAIADVGWALHEVLVWVKQRIVLGHSDYHYQHEFVFYGWATSIEWPGRPGRGRHKGSRWYGGNDKASVFFVDAPTRSVEHPTIKPVGLIIPQLENSTQRGNIVYDPFTGSGSTIIACEEAGRRCRAMEIDPVYCDVVRQRYADFTEQPELAP